MPSILSLKCLLATGNYSLMLAEKTENVPLLYVFVSRPYTEFICTNLYNDIPID